MKILPAFFLAILAASPAHARKSPATGSCQLFAEFDLNGDARIGLKEFAAFSMLATDWKRSELRQSFAGLDGNSDKLLTALEFTGGIHCPSGSAQIGRPDRGVDLGEGRAKVFLLDGK